MKKIYSFLKKLLPNPLKSQLKTFFEKIIPPRIKVTQFIDEGCVFEITSKTERHRVIGLADEEEFLSLFMDTIKPTDIFYDVGGCIGFYTLHAAKIGAQVIVFEPDPGYRSRLIRNIKINKVRKNISVVGWAVSDTEGSAELFTDGVDGNSPSLKQVGKRGSTIVDTNSIDNAIYSMNFPYPTIMKIDIEGAEILALRGMKELLSSGKGPETIYIELHPTFLQNFDATVQECDDLVLEAGYQIIYRNERANQIHCVYKKSNG